MKRFYSTKRYFQIELKNRFVEPGDWSEKNKTEFDHRLLSIENLDSEGLKDHYKTNACTNLRFRGMNDEKRISSRVIDALSKII